MNELLVAIYLIVLVLLAIYGLHRFILIYLYIKHKHNTYAPRGRFDELPRVTIQVPIYNEELVAARVIRACLRDRLPKGPN